MTRYCGIPAGYESDDEYNDLIFDKMQKITIVPENVFRATGLNGQDFDPTLSIHTKRWFESFRENYNSYKRNPSTEQQLKVTLMQDENPCLLALRLFVASPGCNNLRNKSLALFILESITEMCEKYPELSERCDENTRMVAFNLVKYCGISSIYKAVTKAYRLKIIRHYLLPKLQELLAEGYYKDVAYWAMFLELTENFGVFELVFPLILQDKTFLAEEYLEHAPNLQLPLVQFLDSLLNKEKSVMEHSFDIISKHRYINVRQVPVAFKPMLKLVTRLAKKYKIDEKYTPHLIFSKSCGYLRYMLHKYRDGGMNCDAWRELVPEVAQKKEVQIELLKILINYGDGDEAFHWLNKFGLSLAECPEDLRSLLEDFEHLSNLNKLDASSENPLILNKNVNMNASSEDDFLKLTLSEDQIIFVDDSKNFHNMMDYLKKQTLIAFDSEWKPYVNSDNTLSLLQLATRERVYLIDCLSSKLTEGDWRLLGCDILNNLEILKIGFAIQVDLKMLQKSLPLQLNVEGCKAGFLDLRKFGLKLRHIDGINLPYLSNKELGSGLSDMTKAFFGKKLDKSNQCSNWANRPLRPDQITYAALDAHCLILIFEILTHSIRRIGLDINRVVEEFTTGKTGYLLQRRSDEGVLQSTQKVEKNPSSTASAVCASEICFVCERELLSLAKELRKLGIDCRIVPMERDYLDRYTEPYRPYFLTRLPHHENHPLAVEFGRERCFVVCSGSVVDQLIFVLNHFNIRVPDENIFTRCLECNSKEFILASKKDIQLMRANVGAKNQNFDIITVPYPIKHNKQFSLVPISEQVIASKKTYHRKPIRLQCIRDHHLKNVEQFLICDSCGYVVWNGTHSLHFNVAKIVGCETQGFPKVQIG